MPMDALYERPPFLLPDGVWNETMEFSCANTDMERSEFLLQYDHAKIASFDDSVRGIINGRFLPLTEDGQYFEWFDRTTDSVRLSAYTPSTPVGDMVPQSLINIAASFPLDLITSSPSQVILIDARTGSGKSVIAPVLALKAYVDSHVATPARFLHLTPTGVQAISLAEHLHPLYKVTNLNIGAKGPGSEFLKDAAKLDPSKTHYCFATTFNGVLAFQKDLIPDVLILDEIHEMTPEIVTVLYYARLELEKPDSNLRKVYLLSATISSSIIDVISRYFSSDRVHFHHFPLGSTPLYDCTWLRLPCGYKGRDYYYYPETKEDGYPDMATLRNRTASLTGDALARAQSHEDGILTFCSGKIDILMVKEHIDGLQNMVQHVIYIVSAKDRKDVQRLSVPSTPRDGVRVVLSTSLLETGVTPLSVQTVIDGGTVKFKALSNRFNIQYVVTLFEDYSTYLQRAGRVGRVADGICISVLSPARFAQVKKADHSSIRFHSRITMVFYIQHVDKLGDLLIKPIDTVTNGIVFEMKILGYLDATGAIKEWVTRIANGGMDMQLLDFVISSQGSGCEALALLYASGYECGFEYFTKNVIATSELPTGVAKWLEVVGSDATNNLHSDIESIAEMLLNVVCIKIPESGYRLRPNLPTAFLDSFDMDDLGKIWRTVGMFRNSMNACGMKIAYGLFDERFCKVDLSDGFFYYRLDPLLRPNFRALINRVFGVRAVLRNEKISHSTCSYYAFPNAPGGRHLTTLQGEAQYSHNYPIAIYHYLARKTDHEDYLQGQFHYLSRSEFAITGGCINATPSDFDDDELSYKIKGMFCNLTIKIRGKSGESEPRKLYQAIKHYRLTLAKATEFAVHSSTDSHVEFWTHLTQIGYAINGTIDSMVYVSKKN